jgi:phospholipid transport system substrate-binding protein
MKLSIVLPALVLLATSFGAADPAVAQGKSQAAPAAAAATDAAASQQPSEIVQTSAQGILKDLEKDRDAYRKDPSKVGTLVDRYLLPHFDTEYAARLVLAQHWRTATPEQRKRFVDAFYHSLLTNYGSALAEFTADRLKVYPTNVLPTDDHATVRTEVKRDNGDRVAVNYSLHKVNGEWKAYDVNIEGISYVKSYRDDFGSQIQQQGIDAVIARLEKGEKPGEIKKTTSSVGKS